MSMVSKVEFDAMIAKSSIFDAVKCCNIESARIEKESNTLGGRKWAYSQYRRGYDMGKQHVVRWNIGVSRAEYVHEVLCTMTRIAQTTNPKIVKSALVLSLMRLAPSESSEYKIQQKDAIVRDLDATRGRRAIVNVDRYVEIAENMLTATSYIKRILGLCALTGRRTIEIGCTAVFEKIDSNHVRFTGQAKTRQRIDIGPYVIPTLCDSDTAIDVLQSIRDAQPDLPANPDLFHNRCVNALNSAAKEMAECFSDNRAKSKDMRAAYAEIAWLLFDERRTGKALYFSRILGHGAQDIATAQSYDDFVIVDANYA